MLGVGGNVSQGILKALALADPCPRVVAACVDPEAMGLYSAELALLSPYADDPGFLDWLLATCAAEEVTGILSGVEPVLDVLAGEAARIERETGARCVVSDPDVLAIGADKLETSRWLSKRGLPAPLTAPADDSDAVDRLLEATGVPLIVKPRRGKGSSGVVEVLEPSALEPYLGRADLVLQQRLEGDEYTVATFSDRDGTVRGSACMRRRLAGGTTSYAEMGPFDQVRAAAEAIVSELRPSGPANVQLRMQDGKPVCFELNIRFSGTAPIRARLGFNDVEAALRHLILGEPAVDLPPPRPGHAVRYWNELYIDPSALERLRADGRLEVHESGAVEDFGMARDRA